MTDQTVEVRLPPKRHVDLFLALVAGALAVLVVLTARGAFVTHTSAITPAPIVSPTAGVSAEPPAQVAPPAQAAPAKQKGKGHD